MEKIVLVASGKGGVGKTTLTANLAQCLAKNGKKVLLMDADILLRNLDIVLGIQDEVVFDIQDLFYKRCNEDKAVVTSSRYPGISFISAPLKLSIKPDEMFDYIYKYSILSEKLYDYILIDCPAGIGNAIEKMAKKRTRLLCVATPELTSIRDAERVCEYADKNGVRNIKMIINRLEPKSVKKRQVPNIDDIIDSVSVQLLGIIPEDKNATTCTNKGILICDRKKSKAKKAFENIALRLDGKQVELYVH